MRATEEWGPDEGAGRGPALLYVRLAPRGARRRREAPCHAAPAAEPAQWASTDENAARREPSACEPGHHSSVALSAAVGGAAPRARTPAPRAARTPRRPRT